MYKYEFEIDEKIQPMQRPRYNFKTHTTFVPSKTKKCEEKIRKAYTGKKLDTKIYLEATLIYEIPKSKTKKEKQRLLEEKYCSSHAYGDIDNLTKTILDALNGIAYYDDSQVVKIKVEKVYGWEQKTRIKISEI